MGHRGGTCRGIFLDPDGNTMITYERGMGQETNYQVERYALNMGLEFIIALKIHEVSILEGYLLVITQARRKVVREETVVGRPQQQIIGDLN